MTDFSITSGEPWGGVSVESDNINIKAGRKNNKISAEAFAMGCTANNTIGNRE